MKAETRFKELLDLNKIPYLYIGQNALGVEKSEILINDLQSKRPDYLVQFPNIGSILFDVKCRRKIKCYNSNEEYFTLFFYDLERLINLQNSFTIPLWIAFIDKSQLESEKPTFYFIAMSDLIKLFNYIVGLAKLDELIVLRIPEDMFKKIKSKIKLDLKFKNFDEEDFYSITSRHVVHYEFLSDEILGTINNVDILKTQLVEELYSIHYEYFFFNEIKQYLDLMIEKRIIKYDVKKPLKINKV